MSITYNVVRITQEPTNRYTVYVLRNTTRGRI